MLVRHRQGQDLSNSSRRGHPTGRCRGISIYDCAYEELLQGLGLINDDGSLPWTMFNDNVQMGFFDTYDQYLVNILYDPRIRPGMTKAEVDKLLPDVLPTVRAWVTTVNAPTGAGARDSASASRP